MMDVRELATLLHCSTKHVRRLTAAGVLPKPVRLGGLVRWNRAAIEAWVAEGCPVLQANSNLPEFES